MRSDNAAIDQTKMFQQILTKTYNAHCGVGRVLTDIN